MNVGHVTGKGGEGGGGGFPADSPILSVPIIPIFFITGILFLFF